MHACVCLRFETARKQAHHERIVAYILLNHLPREPLRSRSAAVRRGVVRPGIESAADIQSLLMQSVSEVRSERARLQAAGLQDEVIQPHLNALQAKQMQALQRLVFAHQKQSDDALQWCEVLKVQERFLDPTSPSDHFRLRDFFDRRNHLAIRSAQGTAKTDGVLLVELLRCIMRDPSLRVLSISNRITYKDDLKRRFEDFNRSMEPRLGVNCAFAAYSDFPCTVQGTAALIQAPRLICSLESLHRLSPLTLQPDGSITCTPQYDLILLDEMMELHAVFHGKTMDHKRKRVHQLLTSLCRSARRVWAADADLTDQTALPFLRDLCNQSFALLWNTQKTIQRVYHQYVTHARWRLELVRQLQLGKKVVVPCTSKTEALLISMDPSISRLGLNMAVLTRDSSAEVYDRYIRTTAHWQDLDLLIYSPVIGAGLDFNLDHFDVAFLFCTDHSTGVRQSFQQLNRVRKLRDNAVHMFLCLHRAQHQHLPATFEAVRQDIDQVVATMKHDYFIRVGHITRAYQLDFGVDHVTMVRKLLDTAYNQIFVRNQHAVNDSRLNFPVLFDDSIRSSGGEIRRVASEELNPAAERTYYFRKKDLTAQQEEAILQAREITDLEDRQETSIRLRNALTRRPGDQEASDKADLKDAYRIPLSDTHTLQEIDDFMTRFGTCKRLTQRDHLQRAAEGGVAMLLKEAEQVIVEGADYVENRVEELKVQQQAEKLLALLGFLPMPAGHPQRDDVVFEDAVAADHDEKMEEKQPVDYCAGGHHQAGVAFIAPPTGLWSNMEIDQDERKECLNRDARLQSDFIRVLESLPYSSWWMQHKQQNEGDWVVENHRPGEYRLEAARFEAPRRDVDDDGVALLPLGALLYSLVVKQARTFFRDMFGVHLRSFRRRTMHVNLHYKGPSMGRTWNDHA